MARKPVKAAPALLRRPRAKKPKPPAPPLVVFELNWSTKTDASVSGYSGLFKTRESAQKAADEAAKTDENKTFSVTEVVVAE